MLDGDWSSDVCSSDLLEWETEESMSRNTTLDPKQAMAIWNEINALTIQVSKLKENFARMIDGTGGSYEKDDRSRYRVRPPVLKKAK
jgi:hypothetical protein